MPMHLAQYRYKIREGSLKGIWVTMEERICERDEFLVWSERSREWQMVRATVVTAVKYLSVR